MPALNPFGTRHVYCQYDHFVWIAVKYLRNLSDGHTACPQTKTVPLTPHSCLSNCDTDSRCSSRYRCLSRLKSSVVTHSRSGPVSTMNSVRLWVWRIMTPKQRSVHRAICKSHLRRYSRFGISRNNRCHNGLSRKSGRGSSHKYRRSVTADHSLAPDALAPWVYYRCPVCGPISASLHVQRR